MCLQLILTQLNKLKLREMDKSLKHLAPGEVPKRETVQADKRSWIFGSHHLCEFIIKYIIVNLAALG